MNGRCLAACLAVVGVLLLVSADVAGQTLEAADGWAAPRTPWGDPDLQGTWTNTTTTPLERPDDIEAGSLLSDEERSARDEERDRS